MLGAAIAWAFGIVTSSAFHDNADHRDDRLDDGAGRDAGRESARCSSAAPNSPRCRRKLRWRSPTWSSSRWFSVTGRFCGWSQMLPATIAGISSLSVPVVGVFSGMLISGEQPGVGRVGGAGLDPGGVAVVRGRRMDVPVARAEARRGTHSLLKLTNFIGYYRLCLDAKEHGKGPTNDASDD